MVNETHLIILNSKILHFCSLKQIWSLLCLLSEKAKLIYCFFRILAVPKVFFFLLSAQATEESTFLLLLSEPLNTSFSVVGFASVCLVGTGAAFVAGGVPAL